MTKTSPHVFTTHPRLSVGNLANEEIQALLDISQLKYSDPSINPIDDDKYSWKILGSWLSGSSTSGKYYEGCSYGISKYGRSAYCINTGVRRSLTMGEFYENSAVD